MGRFWSNYNHLNSPANRICLEKFHNPPGLTSYINYILGRKKWRRDAWEMGESLTRTLPSQSRGGIELDAKQFFISDFLQGFWAKGHIH